MTELTPAPELVDPATESLDSAPEPVDGQQVESPADATPPQTTYKIGDEEFDVDTLTDFIQTAKNAKEMHRSAHEEYTAAKKLREDPKYKRLQYIMETIEQNPNLANEWRQLETTTFDRSGAPTNALAMSAQMREIRAELDAIREEKGVLVADDYLGQFAAEKGITKEQAEEVGAAFLASTTAEDFPDTNVMSHLKYFYWDRYEREGAEQKLTAAKAEGYKAAIEKVKKGQAAELGSPATRTEVPWTPSKNAHNRPMEESYEAALNDPEVSFGDLD